jgi:redox-sensitive bicupin YhaK (pirin superfamily)
MIRIRPSRERGRFNHGWLDTRHTFSFAEYTDPKHMGFRSLRVINEDIVKAGKGFGTHPHRDMEIITYVLEGSVQHKDSMGNGSVIRPGDVQRMSAGTGVTHSEFNPSDQEDLHLLQIWILPETRGIKPDYEQKMFKKEDKLNRLRLVASGRPKEGAVKVHQDVDLYAAVLEKGAQVSHTLNDGRHAWLQVARGSVSLNGHTLGPGDGAALSDERSLSVTAEKEAEVLLFDMG